MIYTYSVVPTPAVAGLAGIGLLGMRRRRRR
jgi:MYXO-CTERM domain-containing protein